MNQVLIDILHWIQSWVGSWGWAMVVFTIMIRLVMTPLDLRSRTGMRRTQKLQPKLAELQKKYANDKEKLNQKTAELYKKEGINPLSSCLPLLLTWPILIIVFNAMRAATNQQLMPQIEAILNNQQPPMESWLWIRNLWMPDNIFHTAWPDLNTMRMIPSDIWQNWFAGFTDGSRPLPVLLQDLNLTAVHFDSGNINATIEQIYKAMCDGNAVYLSNIMPVKSYSMLGLMTLNTWNDYNGYLILPVLSAVTQIIMTKVTGGQQKQPDNPNQPNTGKFMMWFFPIFSLILCFSYSSAFALYWVAGNLVSMVQTVVINKVLDEKEKKLEAKSAEKDSGTLWRGKGSIK